MPTARPLDVYMARVLAEHPDWDPAQVRRGALTLLRRKAARARWDRNGSPPPEVRQEYDGAILGDPVTTMSRPDQIQVMVAAGETEEAAESRVDDGIRSVIFRVGGELRSGVDGRLPLAEAIDRAVMLLEVARAWCR